MTDSQSTKKEQNLAHQQTKDKVPLIVSNSKPSFLAAKLNIFFTDVALVCGIGTAYTKDIEYSALKTTDSNCKIFKITSYHQHPAVNCVVLFTLSYELT